VNLDFCSRKKVADNSQDPTLNLEYTGYPTGTLYLGFWSFIGEFGSALQILNNTYLGSFLLAVYLLFANILLVNLLIAMMADTYSVIRENSDLEWKFSRYSLIQEYSFANLLPPPLNLILYFIQMIYYIINCSFTKPHVLDMEGNGIYRKNKKEDNQVKELLEHYKEAFLEHEELNLKESVENSIQMVRDRVDLINLHRVEDRDYMESKFKSLEQLLQKISGEPNK